MKQIAIITLLLLTACKESAQHENTPQWASIDQLAIERKVKELLIEATPYTGEYAGDERGLKTEIRSTQRQVSSLGEQAKESCYTNSSDTVNYKENDIVAVRYTERMALKALRKYDQKCLIAAVENDPLIQDLKKKVERLEKIQSTMRQHSQDMQEQSKNIAMEKIQQYAQDKYILVIDKRAKIIFNPQGITLDISDAVLNSLEPLEKHAKKPSV